MNIGDVVCLKSGGPVMTVTQLFDAAVEVVWFNLNNDSQSAVFKPASLTLMGPGFLNPSQDPLAHAASSQDPHIEGDTSNV